MHSQASALIKDSAVPRRQRLGIRAALLFVLLVCVYMVNMRGPTSADGLPSRFLPFSILFNGNFQLDWMVDAYLREPPDKAYYLAKSRDGHFMSAYPVMTAIVVTPLYVPVALWLSSMPPAERPARLYLWAAVMEKLSAAVLTALSAAVLYLAVAKVAPANAGIAIALIYAIASNSWSISSQTFWTHALTELCFALLLWLLFDGWQRPRNVLFAGIVLAVAAANRPSNVLILLPFLVFFAVRGRRTLLLFVAPIAILGGAVAAYNWSVFGTLWGGYLQAHTHSGRDGVMRSFALSGLQGFPGLLISPNRGMFVYMPWTIFAVAGMVKAWGGAEAFRSHPWIRHAIAGAVAGFVLHALYGRWWAGASFGPRYVSDLLPFLALFLVPVWPALNRRKALYALFSIAVIASVGVQAVGAFYYDMQWDLTPVHIDDQPSRVWDFRDTQIGRALHSPPVRPSVYYALRSLFKQGQ